MGHEGLEIGQLVVSVRVTGAAHVAGSIEHLPDGINSLSSNTGLRNDDVLTVERECLFLLGEQGRV